MARLAQAQRRLSLGQLCQEHGPRHAQRPLCRGRTKLYQLSLFGCIGCRWQLHLRQNKGSLHHQCNAARHGWYCRRTASRTGWGPSRCQVWFHPKRVRSRQGQLAQCIGKGIQWSWQAWQRLVCRRLQRAFPLARTHSRLRRLLRDNEAVGAQHPVNRHQRHSAAAVARDRPQYGYHQLQQRKGRQRVSYARILVASSARRTPNQGRTLRWYGEGSSIDDQVTPSRQDCEGEKECRTGLYRVETGQWRNRYLEENRL